MLFKDYLYTFNISVTAVQPLRICQCQESEFTREQNVLYREISSKSRGTCSEEGCSMCPLKNTCPTIYSYSESERRTGQGQLLREKNDSPKCV